MKYDPEKHHRQSIRLKDYDYSLAGAYYVTICTQGRQCLFGSIVNDEMVLNDAGMMIKNTLMDLALRFDNLAIIDYVIMPNHIHIVAQIKTKLSVGVPLVGTPNEEELDQNRYDAVNDKGSDNDDKRIPTRGTPNEEELDQNRYDTVDDKGSDNDDKRIPTRGTPNEEELDQNRYDAVNDKGSNDDKRVPTRGTPTTLGDIIGAFKSITTNEYIRGVKQNGWEPFPGRLWQNNYYEHIIRNDVKLARICKYINENPQKWATDEDNPANIASNTSLHGTRP